MSQVQLSVKNAVKEYRLGGLISGTTFRAVNEVNFELYTGKPEVFSIIGESGSGKTTLSRMILRLIKNDGGTIELDGKDLNRIKGRKGEMDFMSRVQPIFQNPFETFNPLSRVDRYLLDTAQHFFPDDPDPEKRVEEALEAVGLSLEEIGKRYPHELSGGQLQRTSIARAIIPKPEILIADEPVSMIDASLRMSIVNLFSSLKERFDTSIIYITHDLATAYYVSDRIAIMHRGIFVEQGPARGILENPRHPYTKLLVRAALDPSPDAEDFDYKPSRFEGEEFTAKGCLFADRCEEAGNECFHVLPCEVELEDRIIRCLKYNIK
ncbi:MAG: ABC transporter ATP-binding protein [Spirochaetales bacterium]|nr:ABC transporter ATP-binding protein [Spirochaetales bacterium]